MASKIFKDPEAKKMFVSFYEQLEPDDQTKFGAMIRDLANTKVMRLDDVDDFYLSAGDVEDVYERLTQST